MRTAVIDGAAISDKQGLHDALVAALGLQEWYGRNLDALFDCLTDISEDTELTVTSPESLIENLGEYARRFFVVLKSAERENSLFSVMSENGQN